MEITSVIPNSGLTKDRYLNKNAIYKGVDFGLITKVEDIDGDDKHYKITLEVVNKEVQTAIDFLSSRS